MQPTPISFVRGYMMSRLQADAAGTAASNGRSPRLAKFHGARPFIIGLLLNGATGSVRNFACSEVLASHLNQTRS